MATGERPFSSGKLKVSEERLASKLNDVETQLVLHEDMFYPKRYMAQLAFQTTWMAKLDDTTEEKREKNKEFRGHLNQVDGINRNLRPLDWHRQRDILKKSVMDNLDPGTEIELHEQAMDEWRDSIRHENDITVDEFGHEVKYSNGFTRFRDPVRQMLGILAANAVGPQVGDFTRERKQKNYSSYVANAHTTLDQGLFMSHEDVKNKELIAQTKSFDSIVHLEYRRKLYLLGDSTLRQVRFAQAFLTAGQREKLQLTTPDRGSDEVITESIVIPELIAA